MGIAHEIVDMTQEALGTAAINEGDPLGRVIIDKNADWGATEDGDRTIPLQSIKLSAEELETLRNPRMQLHIYGYFRYSDLFETVHETGFHYSYIAAKRLLVSERPPALWFDRVVKPRPVPVCGLSASRRPSRTSPAAL